MAENLMTSSVNETFGSNLEIQFFVKRHDSERRPINNLNGEICSIMQDINATVEFEVERLEFRQNNSR